MPLAPGARLGVYEILSHLGSGGMGEVWRARDPKLGREVAIKVVSEGFAHDPERVARLQREAQSLAALNHPNIAAIYGFEDANGTHALVMELVEGPTLADRIARGRIPVNEALPIARQIAEALEAAHEQGIVHRDLKPSNIKVRGDGTVKVLDFGLAKAMEAPAAMTLSVTQSPTITTPAMTQAGVILGTAAYMSPEQAKGHPADRRSDIWAFGCVLYEMLAGQRAFEGEDVSDVFAAVLRGDPSWTALSRDTPPAVRRLLERCLTKDMRQRLSTISTALFVLDEHARVGATAGDEHPVARRRFRAGVLAAAGAGAAALIAALSTWAILRRSATTTPAVTSTALMLPATDRLPNQSRHVLALSADGTRVVYTANNRLYLRSLDRFDAVPIVGTEGQDNAAPLEPFFSPDGNWVAFWQTGQLKKVLISGGAPLALAEVAAPNGASWEDDGSILLGEAFQGIQRVPAAGGKVEVVVSTEAVAGAAEGPHLLPGGKAIVYTRRPAATNLWDRAQILVRSLETGEQRVLIDEGTDARYLPTGHLVYVKNGILFAVPFDVSTLKLTGAPAPVLDHLLEPAGAGAAQYSVSRTGSLVYLRGDPPVPPTLVWADRQGHERALSAPPRAYGTVRLSPDGTLAAFDIRDQDSDVWVWNFARETLTRVTFDAGADRAPVWTPDGLGVVFGAEREGADGLFWRAADGSGSDIRLTTSKRVQTPTAFSPDGTHLVFYENDVIGARPTLRMATFAAPLTREGAKSGREPELTTLELTPFGESNAEISPDGRWLAYQSNESGARYEVYVRPFPNLAAGKWQVSTKGGTRPSWARNGRELFYLSATGALMSVSIPASASWAAGNPTMLFDGPYVSPLTERSYDATLDGREFLMIKSAPVSSATSAILLVEHWQDTLTRLFPPK